MKRWTVALIIVVSILAIAGITIMSARFDSEVAVRVFIPKGATKSSVRDSLRLRLGESYGAMVYRLWSVAAGDPAAAHGSYLVEPGTSALETAHKIKEGRESPVKVTLNNMRTLDDLTKRLGSKIEATPADFKAALNKVLKKDNRFSKPEEFAAAFLPDTYEFYWTDDPEHVITRLVDEQKSFWNEERMLKAKKLGLTPVEVATIASIVEAESNKKDEHSTIARLYMNRLEKGMKLQSDPTVVFATGNFKIRRVTGKHLKTDSPYNTYKNNGLPPGPIRIPQKSTIDAVLNAPEHDYIYMCAKEDFSGRHNFAVDYAQHKRNAARYQARLNKRGIR
ncbi:MAG: endolytic transglycosylase MltG [Bacteroidales bacterium]|nr:endolytic transglycosylase MltG [Bacteroidales bacterium]